MKIRRGFFRIFVVWLAIWGAVFFGIAGALVPAVGTEFAPLVYLGALLLWLGAVIVILGTGKTAAWMVDGFRDEEKAARKRLDREERREFQKKIWQEKELRKARGSGGIIDVGGAEKPREMRIWSGASSGAQSGSPHPDGGYWHHVPKQSERRW